MDQTISLTEKSLISTDLYLKFTINLPSLPYVNFILQSSLLPGKFVQMLVIGNNYTGTSNALNGCVNDIFNISKTMKNMYDVRDSTIKKLSFPEGNCNIFQEDCGKLKINYLYDVSQTGGKVDPDCLPNKQNILNNLDYLVRNVSKFSTIIIHYSDHGGQLSNISDDFEETTKDSTWIPLDFRIKGEITDDYINDSFLALLKKNVNVLIISDCCHSGTIADLPIISTSTGLYTKQPSTMKNFTGKNASVTPKILCISGCTDNQTSADALLPSPFNSNQKVAQGAITNALINVLKSPAGVNQSINSILDIIRRNLKQNDFEQTPQLTSNIGIFNKVSTSWSVDVNLKTFLNI